MPLTLISHLLETELRAVNEAITQSLSSQVDAIKQIGHYIINSGGKRIRPLVILLSSKACQGDTQPSIIMAAIIEFIHTATLLHDDVVDGSELRRGRPTANHVWDNASAVLVGDFLYSRAFQMMVSVKNMDAMRILADATNTIAEGEVLQLAHRNQPDVHEASYFNVIRLKTAKLFEAAAQLGALMGNQPPPVEQALASYGMHIGTAFQLVDDVLDYRAAKETWGKNLGDDLAEGKITLPLIYALKKGDATQSQHIREAIVEGDLKNFQIIQEAIVSTGAIDYTMRAAEQEIQHALQALTLLPDSPYRDALASLANFAISRAS